MRHTSAVIFGAVLAIDAAAADQSARLDLRIVSDDAVHYGEYNGLYERRAYAIGALDLDGTLPWSADGRWSVDARNLGLGTYDASLAVTEQGRYALHLGFDGKRQFKRDDGHTPFIGQDTLVLPGSWVAGPTTAAMAGLNGPLRRFDQHKDRDIVRFDAWYLFGPHWQIDAGFKHEDKRGAQALGAAMFVDAARGNSALLPAPIDYATQDFTSTLHYRNDGYNASLAYLYTRFDNEHARLTWTNPYASVVAPVADYPNGRGSLSLAPDYDRQQVRVDGSATPLAGLHVQWDGAWSATRQNDDFLPYTVNTALVVTEALPRTSLDAELITRSSDVRINYRPRSDWLRKLSLRGTYHFDERDYDKPSDAYRYVRGDGADQPPALAAILATAHDTQREGFDAGADYRLPWWRSKVSFEYRYQDVERGNVAVEETETDTYHAVLRMTPVAALGVRLGWSFTDRKASTYDWAQSYFARRSTDFINQVPDDQRFDNHPALRQYNLANAEIDAFELDLTFAASDRWYFAGDIEWRELSYDRSQFGLLRTESWRYGLDVQFTPVAGLATFAYASLTRYDSDAAGRSFGGGIEKPANRVVPPLPQGSDPRRNWAVSTGDDVGVIGFGATWRYSEQLELEATYTTVATESSNTFVSGGSVFLDTSPLPDVETTLHDVKVTAAYRPRDTTTMSFFYQFFRYEEDDWAFDAVQPQTLPNVVTLGEQADDETVNLIGMSVRYEF